MTDTKIEGTAVQGMVRDVNEKLSELQSNDKVDPHLFRVIMENTDFTNCHNMMDTIMLFYHKIFIHAINPLTDEKISLQKETGRLIVQWDDEKRKNTSLQEEVKTLREQVQRESQEKTQ